MSPSRPPAPRAIINRAALDVESVRISQKQVNDFVTEVDHASEKASSRRCSAPTPAMASWPRNRAASMAPRTPRTSGSSIRWTARPTSSTAFRSTASASRWRSGARSSTPSSTTLRATICSPPPRGRGAFLNDRRLRVSKRIQMKESLIATGFPFRPGDDFPRYLAMMGDVMQRTAGLRRPGAAALDLAYVAAGFTEGFFETGLQPWDVAAGSLLVTEAGGLIGNFSGEPTSWSRRNAWPAIPRSTHSWCRSWANTASSPAPAKRPKCAASCR
jgi:myo-inositol-1(or 4)-monophosphatase